MCLLDGVVVVVEWLVNILIECSDHENIFVFFFNVFNMCFSHINNLLKCNKILLFFLNFLFSPLTHTHAISRVCITRQILQNLWAKQNENIQMFTMHAYDVHNHHFTGLYSKCEQKTNPISFKTNIYIMIIFCLYHHLYKCLWQNPNKQTKDKCVNRPTTKQKQNS